LIHIGAIAIGLLLAIALEQTVEAVHHRHQRAVLEEQIRVVLADDLESDKRSLRALRRGRDYLSDLLAAINARLDKRPDKLPAPDSTKLGGFTVFPNLAPFDVAKQNGTAGVLPTERLRIYNRVAFALDLLAATRHETYHALDALGAFDERYVDSRGSIEAGEHVPGPGLDGLTVPELLEYRALAATSAKAYDTLTERIRLVDFEFREVLGGIPSETALIERLRTVWGKEGREPEPPPE
jgi:hypothetical protein